MKTPVKAATTSQLNIDARANYLYNITWTCQKTVAGWNGNYYFYQGSTYRLPYGQPINSGYYIGYGVTIETFKSGAANASSAFYTYQSSYDGTYSTYYAAGQKFAYWVDKNGKIKSYDATYKFFPSSDVELTAVYVGETETVEKELIVGITADATVEGNNITFIMNWYVPEEVGTFVQGGVIVVESSKYNPETFIYGGNKNDSNITQAYPAKTYQKASQPGTSLTKQNVCYSGDTWYGVTWVRYTDAVTGEEKIAYSDMIAVTKP